MPVWLQIVLGVYAVIVSTIALIQTSKSAQREKKKELQNYELKTTERIVKLETLAKAWEDYLTAILLKNIK
jgi:hypothetical protein